ncbi:lipoyl(octanoyl) transferase LipB [Parabacteroides sp. PF5-9]|uniref:lipoyl(octanoyl) transferase LipB n=1 Tax=Parabacteroides sp. PF5-9 TaxID=1742404 RepID=UPI00247460C0|nr:lipoyl(octanoyl) transferase LipB [Parabacteroides sp. PF5-9]MDH6358609.1 lipoyl(octanoyl) transferase [Parabacteroides sp. PF5-9]
MTTDKTTPFIYHDLGRIDYATALEIQMTAFEKLLTAKKEGKPEENHLFFCEHTPVITMGKSGKEGNLLIPEHLLSERDISFYQTNRGGDITYHGPGQITGYPIFDLEYWQLGLKQYIHLLEEVIIRFLRLYHIHGERLDGATGVWLDTSAGSQTRKICAIGVKSSRYVTMHGFALNINTDLSYYSLMNPCGFTDKGVTSLAQELGETQDFELAKQQVQTIFKEVFS